MLAGLANLTIEQRGELLKTASKEVDNFRSLLSLRKSTRLGIRYETLWQFLYQHIESCTVLACNLPVRSETRTLGEFDLLYQINDKNKSVVHHIHQEMAVKFYLGKPDSNGNWFDWIGPDNSDQLGAKLQKMFDSQIMLSETEEGTQCLEELAGKQNWQRELLVQGYLFYPWKHTCAPPKHSHSEHLRGDWLPIHQLDEYCQHIKASYFHIPPRQFWLSLQAPSDKLIQALHPYSPETLKEGIYLHMSLSNKPILVTGHTKSGQPAVFFVTPDKWLESAKN